jgi:hypothetical protein
MVEIEILNHAKGALIKVNQPFPDLSRDYIPITDMA